MIINLRNHPNVLANILANYSPLELYSSYYLSMPDVFNDKEFLYTLCQLYKLNMNSLTFSATKFINILWDYDLQNGTYYINPYNQLQRSIGFANKSNYDNTKYCISKFLYDTRNYSHDSLEYYENDYTEFLTIIGSKGWDDLFVKIFANDEYYFNVGKAISGIYTSPINNEYIMSASLKISMSGNISNINNFIKHLYDNNITHIYYEVILDRMIGGFVMGNHIEYLCNIIRRDFSLFPLLIDKYKPGSIINPLFNKWLCYGTIQLYDEVSKHIDIDYKTVMDNLLSALKYYSSDINMDFALYMLSKYNIRYDIYGSIYNISHVGVVHHYIKVNNTDIHLDLNRFLVTSLCDGNLAIASLIWCQKDVYRNVCRDIEIDEDELTIQLSDIKLDIKYHAVIKDILLWLNSRTQW